MRNRFLVSAAALALIAGTGFANAQGTGMNRESGGAAAQSAPSTGTSATTPGRDATEPTKPSSGMKATQSEQKSPVGATKSQRADEPAQGQKSKGMSSENETKGGKDMKAEGREGRSDNMKAEGREGQNAQSRDRDQNAQNRERNGNMNAETKSQTTVGQAGAGAKLSTEQRTKITTVIRSEHVAPVNNVDFSISIGTRVPRERVSLRPLPSEVVTIYPEWRGYEFFLIRDQIVVVDPSTLEIVAVLEA